LLLVLPGLLLSACLQEARLPDLGPCAEVPEGAGYEFGQVGIGTCLASPSDLRIRPDPNDPDNYFLFLVNSNSRSNFSGSSLLSIDASSIQRGCAVNGMHELATSALHMQEFAGRIDFEDATGLALLTNRHTGQFEGALTDVVFTIDARNPRDLQFSAAGPSQWGPYRFVTVPADPWAVRINPLDGRAYVLGLTTHEVSALDLTTVPLTLVDMHGERSTSDPSFTDIDASGSDPDFMLLGISDALLAEEEVEITFMGGTTRLYYPALAEDGSVALMQADSGNGAAFQVLPGGPVLRGDQPWAEAGIGAAVIGRVGEELEALLAGESADGVRTIGSARATLHALDWSLASSASLEPSAAGWDAAGLADPDGQLVDGEYRVVYAGGVGLGRGIGHARGASLTDLVRAGDLALDGGADGAVLLPEPGAFDSVAIGSPALLRRGDTGEYLLWYGGHSDAEFDPALGGVPHGLAIGLARSDDGIHYTRTEVGPAGGAEVFGPGPNGSWDAAGVTAPTVFFDNGRFQLWYQGYDGQQWRTGRAISIDGVQWDRDPRNPVFEAPIAARVGDVPQRAFAFKASQGGYYRVEGSATGVVSQYAFEGSAYDSLGSPLHFEVVGGQALGRGPAGSVDSEGASSPSAVGDAVFYTGHQGSARRLVVAADLGAGVRHGQAVRLRGFSGALAGLNGSSPSLPVTGAEARQSPSGDVVVALNTTFGITLAAGEVSLSKGETVLDAQGGNLAVSVGPEESFDALGVAAPSLVLSAPDGSQRLYYSGLGDGGWRIGMVSSTDGVTWSRQGEAGLVFDRGPAGSWDDASVSDPTVIWDGMYRMWYLGSDGEQTRIGYAQSDDGLTWQRFTDSAGVGQWVFDGASLPFVEGSALAPSVVSRDDGELEMWFEGKVSGISRLGRARSDDGEIWAPVTNPTTAGDYFTLRTHRGDENPQSGIHLGDNANTPRFIDGFLVSGAGASEMILSPDGHFGIVANKLQSYLLVLDLFDDSDEDTGYIDSNYNDIEAVIRISQNHGMVGTRDMAFSPDGAELYVLLSPLVRLGSPEVDGFGTEALLRLDWTQIEDSNESVAIREGMVTGYLPLARGLERDQGYPNDVSVGSGSMALSASGERAYVLNFNDNSMYVLDLRAGARGAVIDIIRGLDENPWEVVLSPDGSLAYIANSFGISVGAVQHSTVQVVDIDETSPSYGEVLTRLSNISSRSPGADCVP
jgi:DNA-binding beta-propeller fold protein YncE/predicted GH43/DUF377 family glycosyl hydrolase